MTEDPPFVASYFTFLVLIVKFILEKSVIQGCIEMKASDLLFEYLSIVLSIQPLEESRSCKGFKGYMFVKIFSKFLEENLSNRYRVVLGPLWIRRLEWIEWDGIAR